METTKQEIITLGFASNSFPQCSEHLIPVSEIAPHLIYPLISAFSEEITGKKIFPEKFANQPNRELFVIFEEGKAKSLIALTRLIGSYRCVSYLYVPPEYRGYGYGGKTFAALGALASTRTQDLFLNVRTDNQAALSIYQKYAAFCAGTMTRFARS